MALGIVAGAFLMKTAFEKQNYPAVAGETAIQDGVYTNTITEGDKTAVMRKEIRDGKVYIDIKTYDKDGNLINSTHTEKDLVQPTKKNTEIPTTKPVNQNTQIQKANPLPTNPPKPVTGTRTKESTAMPAAANLQMYKIVGQRVTANSNFPLKVDESTGNVVVVTPNKEVVLGNMPDVIVQKALDAGTLNTVTTVNINADSDSNVDMVLNGSKNYSVFGIINFQLNKTLTVDAQTGSVKNVEQGIVSKVLDTLIK